MTVSNTAPALTISGNSTATVGANYTLNLSATDDGETTDRGATPGAPSIPGDTSVEDIAPPETAFATNTADEDANEQIIAESFRAGSARIGTGSSYSSQGPGATQRFGSVDLAASFSEFELDEAQRAVLWQQLDTLQEQLESDSERMDHISGTATVLTAAFSTGYVIWALRGSFILASFLSTVPTWRSLDPLPIIDGAHKGGPADDDDESLADIAESKPRNDESSQEPLSSASPSSGDSHSG